MAPTPADRLRAALVEIAREAGSNVALFDALEPLQPGLLSALKATAADLCAVEHGGPGRPEFPDAQSVANITREIARGRTRADAVRSEADRLAKEDGIAESHRRRLDRKLAKIRT